MRKILLIFSLSVIFFLPAKASAATIILDPGHGTVHSARKYEGRIELNILLKLRDLLTQKGHTVIMTTDHMGVKYPGTNSEYTEGVYKAEIINNNNPDLVLRLHSDSHNMDRFFIIYPKKQTNDSKGKVGPDDLTTIQKSAALSKAISGSLIKNGYMRHPSGVTGEANLAKKMNTAISTHVRINTALTLIELFGHGNPNRKLINKYSNPDEQLKVANALLQGIEAYLQSPEAQLASNYQPKPNKPVAAPKVQVKITKKAVKKVVKKAPKRAVKKVYRVKVKGKTIRKSKVRIRAHSAIVEKNVTSDSEGNFEVTFDNLSAENHWFEYTAEDFDSSDSGWYPIGSIDLSEQPPLAFPNNPVDKSLFYLLSGVIIASASLSFVMIKKPALSKEFASVAFDEIANQEIEMATEEI